MQQSIARTITISYKSKNNTNAVANIVEFLFIMQGKTMISRELFKIFENLAT